MSETKAQVAGAKSFNQNQCTKLVGVLLADEAKQRLDGICRRRGMTIKHLLGRLIVWFGGLNETEQSIVLGLVEPIDRAEMLLRLYGRRSENGSGGHPCGEQTDQAGQPGDAGRGL